MDFTLLSRLSSQHFVSGQELAEEAGCTRAAIAKRVAALREAGVLVEARSRHGYRLLHPYNWWSAQSLQARGARSHEIHVLPAIDSTNLWMRTQLQGLSPGAMLTAVTDFQRAGRGRRGRQWLSLPGRQITVSWGCCSASAPFVWLGAALAAGVEVAEVLRAQGWPVQLKWPNDLWLDGRKLGGILVEMDAMAEGPTRLVIGLGINEHVLPEEAASLEREVAALSDCTHSWDRHQLLLLLDERVRALLQTFPVAGLSAWHARWSRLDALAGQAVRFEQDGVWHEGVAAGIDAQGALQVRLANGHLHACHAGEVSVRPQS